MVACRSSSLSAAGRAMSTSFACNEVDLPAVACYLLLVRGLPQIVLKNQLRTCSARLRTWQLAQNATALRVGQYAAVENIDANYFG